MRIIPRPLKHQIQSHGLSSPSLLLLLLLLVLAATSPAHATISSSTFTPDTYSAGAVATVDITLTTSLDIPVGGALVITFPLGFYANPTATTLANPSGIDASSAVSATPGESSIVTITITGTVMTAGSIGFTLGNIFNPGTDTTAMFKIQSFDDNGNLLETSNNIAGLPITQGSTLTNAQLSLASPNAGVATVFTVTFTTGVWLRAGCTIELQFPTLPISQFILPGATFATASGVDAASTAVTVTPATNTVSLTLAGTGSSSGASVSVGFGSIFNPAAQTMGAAVFAVRTRDPQGRIYQENTAVAGTTIISTTLSATVTPASYWAGNVTTYTLSFDNEAYLPQGSVITFTFNTRFDFSAVSLGTMTNLPRVNVALTISTNTLMLTLGVGPVLAGSNRAFTVKNVLNPGSSCNEYEVIYCTTTWEDYSISIADAGSNIFEQNAAVTGTPIVITPMGFGRVRPLLKNPLTTTSMTLLFNTQVKVPIGGKVQVVLPTGFVIDNSGLVAASGQTGISASSTTIAVSGLQISLTIAGAIISPPSTGVSVTFSSITTPTIDATGTYTIRTLDSHGAVLEEIANIIGEGCWTLNGCNNRGTCTLFSHTCICDRGWGAPTDISDYSAPDCTMRVCPAGYAWNTIPTSSTTGHSQLLECSGMGFCNRNTGKCNCVAGFAGNACQRLDCPNKCSGRGECVNMRRMAGMANAMPLSTATTYTGAQLTTTWDEGRIFGCVCDSTWAVGKGSGEIQVTEFFGYDCSLRHCPTENDPDTTVDETNCQGVTAAGGYVAGAAGNICLVECSNRGLCNYKTGTCTCFRGYTGYACQTKDALSSQ